jgi:hypothetical protein
LRSGFYRTFRRSAALALVLWLGGVVCLVVRPADASVEINAGPCAMAAGHTRHARKSGDQKPRAGTPPQFNDSMTCCPLAGQAAVEAGKPRAADTLDLALTPNNPLLAPESTPPTGRPSGKTRVPDRGGTYLRCCVFLI